MCGGCGGIVSPSGLRPGAVRRLCEAPVSLRYAQCYRCEAIQCREDNIRICGLRHWIASPVSILRISRFPRLAKTAHDAPGRRGGRGLRV
ncbi:MAG: hypothetical protein LBM98_00955 [Oscillospiraceae bacterium]|nr:hypothetical protein [Oscillospiraceae bacterium]